MKKNLLILWAFICSVCMFTACGDDEDDNNDTTNTTNVVDNIIGTYDGKMNIYIVADKDIPVAQDLQKDITLVKNSDNSINMELKDLNVPLAPGQNPVALGDIKMNNCPVVKDGNTYKFNATQTLEVALVGASAVTVNGTIADGVLTLPINVKVEQGGLQVKVDYKGIKKN